MKKVLWLTFLMAFAFLFSFKLNLSTATVCIASVDGSTGVCLAHLASGNTCFGSYCLCSPEPDCDYNHCGMSLNCCSGLEGCTSNTYYCVYQNGQWQWSTSKPQNFCCSDADCPAQNNTKGKCDITGSVTGKAYTCYWNPCKSNSDCVDNACCVTSSQDSNPANQQKCVSQGIYSNNATWLCDPPEWNVNQNISVNKSKTQNIFDLILSFFSHFFQR